MRPQPKRGDLILAFVTDPPFDQRCRENITLEQEFVIFLECVERLVKAARERRYVLKFLGRKVIDVLIERFAGINSVLNAVEAGHQKGRKRDVRIARRIGRTKFETFCLR